MKKGLIVLLLWVGLNGCEGVQQTAADVYLPPELGRRDLIRFKQYMVQGKQLYLTHCSSCHKADGSGMQRLYPPLAKADFLSKNLSLSICMIRQGNTDPITVNDINYDIIMPKFDKLSPLEIAEIVTYIGNKWGNQMGFIEVNQVEKVLQKCSNAD